MTATPSINGSSCSSERPPAPADPASAVRSLAAGQGFGSRLPPRTTPSRTAWAWGRRAGGAAILAFLVWRLGTGPFLDGLHAISGWSLAVAAGIAVVTTVCSAWRWSLVARGLQVVVPLPAAIAAYYRSQFLNTVLPGGVLGDVDRGVGHGRDVGDVGRGVRSVAWERAAGQVVQVALAVLVLLILPSPVRASIPIAVAVLVLGVAGGVLVVRARPDRRAQRWSRILRAAGADIRQGLLARDAWPGIVLGSIIVVVGHLATFLLAAHIAGSTAPMVQMLPLAMLVLLAMAVPTNIGGWGPREGVAAWLFGAAGLGADRGLAAATVYGLMVLAATLPGVVVLAIAWLRNSPRSSRRSAASGSRTRLQETADASGLSTAAVPRPAGGVDG